MSSDYAIINTGGKQYRVRPGDVIDVEKLEGEPGGTIEFTDILLTSVNGLVKVGAPKIDGTKVIGEIVEQSLGPKKVSFKYMHKTRRRRARGHRQAQTTISIKEIASP